MGNYLCNENYVATKLYIVNPDVRQSIINNRSLREQVRASCRDVVSLMNNTSMRNEGLLTKVNQRRLLAFLTRTENKSTFLCYYFYS